MSALSGPLAHPTNATGQLPPTPAAARDATRRGIARTVLKRPLSLAAVAWLLVLGALTISASWVSPASPTDQSLGRTLAGPSATHLLGTDQLGRDILARLLFGARVSLLGVLIATAVAVVLGTTAGLIGGYFRSRIDALLSGVADVLMSMPSIVVLLSVAAVFSRNLPILMTVLGVLMSAPVFRVVRGATLDVRNELYITAARTSGLGDWSIIARHVLPRLVGVTVVQTSIVASIALVTQVGLGFLGIDVVPPAPSWGSSVADASTSIGTSLWQIVPPTVVIGLTVLAFSIIGDVTQQALSGRGRRSALAGRSRRSSKARLAGNRSQPDMVDRDPTPSDALLSVRNFSLAVPARDGPLTLVDQVSFDISPGEIVGLVGESGAGKSVTARAILGLYPGDATTSGSIRFAGTDISAATETDVARLRGIDIAFISQEPMVSLSPAFKVGAQLEEIVRTHQRANRRDAARIARTLLETVRIPHPDEVARKYPHELSGGMAQRVVLAIALAGDPRLIIADEPTTALDVSVQMQILELFRSLQRERSLAVLIVTHDWGVVADLCDRAVAMYAGQVVEEADVARIFAEPRHPYTAALRSADPHSQTPGTRLLTIPGQVPPPGSWPIGCRFADRCRFVTDACRADPVALRVVEGTHPVRCIRAEEIGVLDHV